MTMGAIGAPIRSRLLSPHGTGERAGELSHAALIELARRSLRARARAPLRHAQRAKRSEFWGETAKPPRIAPWGLLFTDPRRRLATREKWLRMGSELRTRLRRSLRDTFSPLATSTKSERLRVQVVARREPGRALGFAPSHGERGCDSTSASRTERAHRAFERLGVRCPEPMESVPPLAMKQEIRIGVLRLRAFEQGFCGAPKALCPCALESSRAGGASERTVVVEGPENRAAFLAVTRRTALRAALETEDRGTARCLRDGRLRDRRRLRPTPAGLSGAT